MGCTKNIEKMLSNSLDLQAPWYIENAEYDDKNKYVNVEKNAKFVCPKCDAETKQNCYVVMKKVFEKYCIFG